MSKENKDTAVAKSSFTVNFGLKPIQLGGLENCRRRQEQLEIMLENLAPLMTNVTDVTIVGPLVRDFINLLQKNDEQMIKVAEQLRKEEATDKKTSRTDILLDDKEKQQLLNSIQED